MPITTNTLTSLGQLDLSLYPPTDAFPITASDTNFIEDPDNAGVQIHTRGLSVGTSGNYTVVTAKNPSRTATVYLVAGVIYHLIVLRVNSTDAASTSGIVGWR